MAGRVTDVLARERERRAWELRLQLWTQAAIATELKITQQAVSRILHRFERRLFVELADQLQAYKVEQTRQLEYLASEAVRAWERKKEDPAYLTKAMEALAAIRGIWGLNAPVRKDVTSGGVPFKVYAGFDPDEV